MNTRGRKGKQVVIYAKTTHVDCASIRLTYIGHIFGRNAKEVGSEPSKGRNRGESNPNPCSEIQRINVGHRQDDVVCNDRGDKEAETEKYCASFRSDIKKDREL